MADNIIQKTITDAVKAFARKPKPENDKPVKGILINRDRPAGSGWCGSENCEHITHKTFNEAK